MFYSKTAEYNLIRFKPGTKFQNFIFEIIFVNSHIAKIIQKCFCLILKRNLINLNFKILHIQKLKMLVIINELLI
jgi:hypothetical protein